MIIGVPRERKTLEKRVAITPFGAQELVKAGNEVLIETGAGEGADFSDKQFTAAGCKIVKTLGEVWNNSELIVKVKEPHELEYEYFRKDVVLFNYLHLASMPDVADAMLKGGLTSIAYELVQLPDGRLPLLEPMSEVAGKLSVLNGSYFLLSQKGGRGVLLGGVVGVPQAEVVILGAGIAGQCACEMALGMGAHVTVLDINYKKLEALHIRYGALVRTVHSTPGSIEAALRTADLVIGAVLVPGASTPKLITREMVKNMRKGSVFVDISIDQGGCSETSRPTSLDEPVFIEEGVVHYGVCNMPAQTARTSTMALTAATLPYVKIIAKEGLIDAMKLKRELRNAVNTVDGKITNLIVGDSLGLPVTPVEEMLQLPASPLLQLGNG